MVCAHIAKNRLNRNRDELHKAKSGLAGRETKKNKKKRERILRSQRKGNVIPGPIKGSAREVMIAHTITLKIPEEGRRPKEKGKAKEKVKKEGTLP